jgi:hypothetical protein
LDRNQKRQDDIGGEERKRNRKGVEKREQRERKESFVSSLQAGYLVSRSLLNKGVRVQPLQPEIQPKTQSVVVIALVSATSPCLISHLLDPIVLLRRFRRLSGS